MNSVELLAKLKQLNAKISLAGDKLHVEAPAGVLTAELKNAIAKHKPELIALLSTGEAGKTEQTNNTPLSLQPDGTCYACKNSNWWLSKYGVLVCATCHPPATQDLVVYFLSGTSEIKKFLN